MEIHNHHRALCFLLREKRLVFQDSQENSDINQEEESDEAVDAYFKVESAKMIDKHLSKRKGDIRRMAYMTLGKKEAHKAGIKKRSFVKQMAADALATVPIPIVRGKLKNSNVAQSLRYSVSDDQAGAVDSKGTLRNVAGEIAEKQKGLAQFFHEKDGKKRASRKIKLFEMASSSNVTKKLSKLVINPKSADAEILATILSLYGKKFKNNGGTVESLTSSGVPDVKEKKHIEQLEKLKAMIDVIDVEENYDLKQRINDFVQNVNRRKQAIKVLLPITKVNAKQIANLQEKQMEAEDQGRELTNKRKRLIKNLTNVQKICGTLDPTPIFPTPQINKVADDFSRDALYEKANFNFSDIKLNGDKKPVVDWLKDSSDLVQEEQKFKERESRSKKGKLNASEALKIAQETCFGSDLDAQGFSAEQKKQYYQKMMDMFTTSSKSTVEKKQSFAGISLKSNDGKLTSGELSLAGKSVGKVALKAVTLPFRLLWGGLKVFDRLFKGL